MKRLFLVNALLVAEATFGQSAEPASNNNEGLRANKKYASQQVSISARTIFPEARWRPATF